MHFHPTAMGGCVFCFLRGLVFMKLFGQLD
jgi:hypothetical protein